MMTKEEAMNLVKQVLPCLNIDKKIREAFETLIPELKESDDERIRRVMIEHFKSKTKETWCGLSVANIIAWLEKQNHDGKKWLTPWELNRLETLRYEAGFDAGVRSEKEKQKEQKDYHKLYDDIAKSEWFKKAYEGKSLGYNDEQKEQKPAEWSEEEKMHLYNAIEAVKYVYDISEGTNGFKCVEFLKSLKPQSKQEWSEEDTEMYINVASSLRGYACGLENEEHKKHIKKGLDWLENRFKSLRPEPKQEWSEEDEKNLELIIDCIYTFYPDPVMKYKLKDWLKSLRNSLPKQSDSFCKTNCKGFQETGRCFVDGPCVAKQSWS